MPFRPSLALSLFYLTSFAVLGAYLPYFNLYLDGIGLSGLQIGVISALLPLSQTFAPMAGGMVADRLGRRRLLIIVSIVLGFTAFSLVVRVTTFAGIALVVAMFSVLRASALPLVDATAMEFSEAGGTPYGRMRVWGSVAFITAALGAGRLVGMSGDRSILGLLIALLGINALASFALPGDPGRTERSTGAAGIGKIVRRPEVYLFLLACLLSQAAHGPYYVFYSLHLERAGYSPTAIGLLWAVAVAGEILAMLRMPAILARFGGTLPTMGVCLLVGAIRWWVISWSTAPLVVAAAQTLHAATFAAFHVAAVTHTHRLFGRDRSGSGQAFFSASTHGLGNVLGMFTSGALVDRAGMGGLFAGASGVALLGGAVVLAAMRRPPPGPAVLRGRGEAGGSGNAR